MSDRIVIANCSGFFGDRIAAAREQVDGGHIDVLSGDWLAELTMLILARSKMKNPDAGWARTFLTQLEDVLGSCLDRGIKIVSNAGGLNPAGCADAVRALAERLGLQPRVAYVEGDDVLGRLDEFRAAGVELRNADTGEPLEGMHPITANAYLGGWGIAEALERGADVVVTGRVTDAALVVGPAAWRFGWKRGDWDRLAGAVVAGHVIECGAQATGGNYAFFDEVPGLEHVAFPIAEVFEDGSSVITKHPGTGGLVSPGTVTAQLVYEIASPRYHNPDVTARFDTITLDQDGPDRVRISGVRGEPPPPTTKVGVNTLGGFRNSFTFVLTGLDIEKKAAVAEATLWHAIPGGKDAFNEVDVQLLRPDRDDPATNEQALAYLKVTVIDADPQKVGRKAFGNAAIEMALATYPGFFGTSLPDEGSPYGVYVPVLIPNELVRQNVVIDGERIEVEPVALPASFDEIPTPMTRSLASHRETTRVPLGRVIGARSGDKGGNANVGVWTRDDRTFQWLSGYLTADRFQTLIAESRDLRVERFDLPNIRALNFVVHGLLGRGVAASTRTDPQAKGLGEYLRAKIVDIPAGLV
ncbi:MAG TPA: acyclic terpene utilization AtuA family protein [Actinomycetota bacterium]